MTDTCQSCAWLGCWYLHPTGPWWYLYPTGPLPYCTCPFSTVRETELDRAACACWEKVDHGPAS